MKILSLYVLLIMLFLGLSKGFSPSELKTKYILNERVFANYFAGGPLSMILLDSFQAGFLIKTYFQRFKMVHGFKHPEMVVVRTSPEFWKKNLKNRGMSLFRRSELNEFESVVPMPPGTIYIGDPAYGYWEMLDSGMQFWRFHRAYRHFPKLFYWGEFRPSYEFFEKLEIYLKNSKPFYGLDKEFGTDGKVTIENLTGIQEEISKKEINFSKIFMNFFKLPFKRGEKRKGKME